jgi:hypothetical protein
MILIAHRGLFEGPNENLENTPEQIVTALYEGYHAEIDVWYEDGTWWLGHDAPQYETTYDFLSQDGLWIHCKNMEAASKLALDPTKHIFYHNTDALTLTSKSILWTYPGQQLFGNSIWVQPEWERGWEDHVTKTNCFGICSKHVQKIRAILRK